MKATVWIRLLLVLLLGAILLGVVSCQNEKNGDDSSKDTAEQDETDENKEQEEYPFVIESCADAEGKVTRFNMATRTDRADFIDTPELNGTIINDAVYERNALIEELFQVEITMFEAGDSSVIQYHANITNDVIGGVGQFDAIQGWWEAGLEKTGYLMNVLSFPELDFANDPWWLDDWQTNSTFYDCLTTCNGDLQFEIYYNIELIYFNKTLAQSLSVKDEGDMPISSLVYQHVDNMTWTIDQLQKYGQIAAIDVGEDGYHSQYEEGYQNSQDIFGSLMNGSVPFVAMQCFGAKYVKNTNGEMEFTLNDTHNYDAFEKLFVVYNETEYNCITSNSARSKQSYEVFNDGKALFCWNSFYNAPYIKESGVSYGILPVPMYDTRQGEYITTCNHFSYFAFLITTPDFHKSALVFNAMNALSTSILYDKYFGEYLEFRVSDDPDSSRMIPLIYDSLYFDSAWTNPGFSANASNQFGYCINENSRSIAARMASFSNMANFVKEIKKIHLNIKIGNSR